MGARTLQVVIEFILTIRCRLSAISNTFCKYDTVHNICLRIKIGKFNIPISLLFESILRCLLFEKNSE